MNFFETMKARLVEDGLHEPQADAIMKIVFEDKVEFRDMNGRWGDNVDGYDPGFSNIIYALIRPVAYKWICENAPGAWFRVIFSPGIVGLEGNAMEEYVQKYQRENQKRN